MRRVGRLRGSADGHEDGGEEARAPAGTRSRRSEAGQGRVDGEGHLRDLGVGEMEDDLAVADAVTGEVRITAVEVPPEPVEQAIDQLQRYSNQRELFYVSMDNYRPGSYDYLALLAHPLGPPAERVQAVLDDGPSLEDFLDEESKADFTRLCELLEAAGVKYVVNRRPQPHWYTPFSRTISTIAKERPLSSTQNGSPFIFHPSIPNNRAKLFPVIRWPPGTVSAFPTSTIPVLAGDSTS